MEPVLLTMPQAAASLGLSRSKLYELVASGDIRVIRIGRAVRISRKQIDTFVRGLEEQS